MTPSHESRLVDHFENRDVVVTGGLGFIGGQLVRRLVRLEANVTVIHRRVVADSDLTGRVRLVRGDVRDPFPWSTALSGTDTVFHLAAQTSARRSEEDPATDFAINAEGTWRLLDECRKRCRGCSFVFAGTVTEAGIPNQLPLRGDSPDQPASFYDLHKLAAERFVEYFAASNHVYGTTLRLSSIYGCGGRESAPDCGVLNRMIRAALAGNTLEVFGTEDRLRDYLHVEDTVEAFLSAAAAIERCNGHHYVIGSEEATSVFDAATMVANAVAELTGTRVPVKRVPPPTTELALAKASYCLDTSRFREAAKWSPGRSVRQGIEETVRLVHNSHTGHSR